MCGSSTATKPTRPFGRRLEVAPHRVAERGVLVAPLGDRREVTRDLGLRRACAAGRTRTSTIGAEGSVGAWPLPPKKARKPRGAAARAERRSSSGWRASTRAPPPSCARSTTTSPFQLLDRDDPVGAVHRRDGQQGHAGGVRAVPDAGRPRGREPARARGPRPLHRVLPLEGEEPHRHGRRARRALRRRGAHRARGSRDAARRRPQDRQRDPLGGVRVARPPRRHARRPAVDPPRAHHRDRRR